MLEILLLQQLHLVSKLAVTAGYQYSHTLLLYILARILGQAKRQSRANAALF
jgi:hypothetical protein